MPAVKPKGFIPPDKKTARNSAPPRNDERLDVKLDTSKLEPTKNPNFFVPPQPHDKKAGRASATIRNADRLDARLEALKLEPTRNHEAEDKLRLEALGQHAPGRNRVVKLPIWPPKLSEKRIEFLVRKATTWALANSFVLIPPTPVDPNEDPDRPAPVPPPTRAQPAPLSLFPTPFPRRLYQQANSLQNMLNSLYMRVSLDHKFLDKVIGGSVIQVDEFQHLLWFFWRKSRNDAYADRQLGIFRSDYLLHESETGKPLELRQVEFNTIASSFGALSQRANELHRYLTSSTRGYWGVDPLLQDMRNYASPKALYGVAEALAHAHRTYGNRNAIILFVVQPNERNIFDQALLEHELHTRHGIRVERRTFRELIRKDKSICIERTRDRLVLPNDIDTDGFVEVGVVYFRAGYSPEDMLVGSAWEARDIIERSRAIKCPSMSMQLAGAKKVQQVLSEPGVLEDFLLGENRPDTGFGKGRGVLTDEDVKRIRETWMGMWPMDKTEMGLEGKRLAMNEPERFVLKPQREGGGNNIYRTDIPPHLRELGDKPMRKNGPSAVEQYILMELIKTPSGIHNWLLKGGDSVPRKAEVVSELGIYGAILYFDEKVVMNKKIGSLLRTKGKESDEGGVAIGISSIDSPLLIEEDFTGVAQSGEKTPEPEEFDPVLGC